MPNGQGKLAHNLPLQFTSFIGREQEIGHVRRELARSRLVTLTGSGGIGKTRLALRVALEELDAYEHGVWFVDLAGVQDAALVPDAVARALAIRERPTSSLVAALEGGIGERRLLLILDNCEHLVAACAELADTLMRACPELRLLSTSREALEIGAERVWRVPPLHVPPIAAGATLQDLKQSEAAALFVERASAVRAEFLANDESATAIAEICRRLEGIPLAIELAASRAKHLAIQQIAEHLDDQLSLLSRGSRSSPSRQQTLRATIDWSYQLLSEPERLLFDRLSVFSGGWTLEAAQAVCAATVIHEREVLDLLGQLVDKSLVFAEFGISERAQYGMFETMHEYAREQLRLRGQQEVDSAEHRHLEFFIQLAERAHVSLGAIGEEWLERLDREHDNFRAALRRTILSRESEHAERLAGALYPLWLVRGYLSEGRSWLSQILEDPEPAPGARGLWWRARALHGLGTIAYSLGDNDVALSAFSDALALWQQVGDQSAVAFTAIGLGNVRSYLGDLATARDMYESGIAAARQSQQPVALGLGLAFLSRVEQDARNPDRARQLAEEGVTVASGCGFTRAVCISLVSLGDVLHERGDLSQARAVFHDARLAAQRAHDPIFASYASSGLARIALDQGDLRVACDELIGALTSARQIGEKRGLAHAVECVASVAVATAHPAEALILVSAAAAARGPNGPAMRRVERDRLAPFLAEARASLSHAAAAQAWERGRTLPLDQAAEVALQLLQSLKTRVSLTAAQLERPSGLSTREVQVLRLLADGKTSKQIAAELVTSVHTVNNQIASIYAKIGASGKADAVAFAIRSNLA